MIVNVATPRWAAQNAAAAQPTPANDEEGLTPDDVKLSPDYDPVGTTRRLAREAIPQLPANDKPGTGIFGSKVPGYTGPADGLSHPSHGWVIKPLLRGLVGGRFRVQIENEEILRTPGAQVFCPTHPTAFDPAVVADMLTHRDVRYMANAQIFRSVAGTLLTWGGAFPVDREGAAKTTMEHTRDILQSGASVCIFPEGTLMGLHGQVGPIKKGAAAAALQGGADNIIPIGIEYKPDTQKRPLEAVAGALAACAVAAGGVLSAVHGGPGLQVTAAVLGTTLTAGFAGGKLLRRLLPEGSPQLNGVPRYLGGLAGGVAGGLLGAVGAGLACWLAPGCVQTLATFTAATSGVATWSLAGSLRHRDIAHVVVGQPIPVAPYAQNYPFAKGARILTEDLHRSLGHLKEGLTGVPYDENAPKIGGKIKETLKQNQGGLLGLLKKKKKPAQDKP
ncbi:MAG: lysophospholipid acyltransferase family protein [Candidatus Eremiobacterota bacterium]